MRFYINREYLLKEIEYPEIYQSKNLFKSAGVILSTVLMFLLLFKPFGVYAPELKINYFFICGLHALCPAIIIFIYFRTLNYFRERNDEPKSWSLLEEYGHIGVILFSTGITSFLVRNLIYNNPYNWSFHYLQVEISNCFVAGIFLYFFIRLTSFYFQSGKGSSSILQFIRVNDETVKTTIGSILFIHTQVKQDNFSLDIDNLLFVKADGNYIELNNSGSSQLNAELKRISLTQFETQISAYPHIFRCHRAYLVNILKIKKITGNSQGYLLYFDDTKAKVPVSRKHLDSFNSYYEQLRQQHNA
jgi:hypothetical protein